MTEPTAKATPLRLVWTCSNFVHHEHRWRWTARLCGLMQRVSGSAMTDPTASAAPFQRDPAREASIDLEGSPPLELRHLEPFWWRNANGGLVRILLARLASERRTARRQDDKQIETTAYRALVDRTAAERDAFTRAIADIVDPTERDNEEPPHQDLTLAAVRHLREQFTIAEQQLAQLTAALAQAQGEREVARAELATTQKASAELDVLREVAKSVQDFAIALWTETDPALATGQTPDLRDSVPALDVVFAALRKLDAVRAQGNI